MSEHDEPNIRERHFDVDSNFDGWRLDQFLANRLGRVSRTRAAEIARYGDVALIGRAQKLKASTRLRRGDVVVLRERLAPEVVQDDEVRVLFEDDVLLILDKPAGMLVHEAASVRLNTVEGFLRRQGFEGAEAAHRIDRETSGVLVCARRREDVPTLRGMFATDHPEKVYRALALDPGRRWEVGARATLTTPLGQDAASALSIKMGRGELSATTHVLALAELELPGFGRVVDLEVQIETGRQHQIRVHLAMEGTPIAGDKLYSMDDAFFCAICDDPDDPELRARLPFPRHALHAWRLGMRHPRTREVVRFEAPLPTVWSCAQV